MESICPSGSLGTHSPQKLPPSWFLLDQVQLQGQDPLYNIMTEAETSRIQSSAQTPKGYAKLLYLEARASRRNKAAQQ